MSRISRGECISISNAWNAFLGDGSFCLGASASVLSVSDFAAVAFLPAGMSSNRGLPSVEVSTSAFEPSDTYSSMEKIHESPSHSISLTHVNNIKAGLP